MHWTCLAPVLSATSNQVRIWIMVRLGRPSALRLRHDLDEPPPLRQGDRTGLHQPHPVALVGLALLIVGLEPDVPPDVLAVLLVLLQTLHLHRDRLLHLGGDPPALDDSHRLASRRFP